MSPVARTDEALRLFQALRDASRLRLLGLLAIHPHSVEELSAVLRLRPAAAGHHHLPAAPGTRPSPGRCSSPPRRRGTANHNRPPPAPHAPRGRAGPPPAASSPDGPC